MRTARRGFTLVELAGPIAALLMFALLASALLRVSRVDSRTGMCLRNQRLASHGLMQRVHEVTNFSAAYFYPNSPTGTGWNVNQQQAINPNPANGYLHWSSSLLTGGYVTSEAVFQCPSVPRGGAPRSNPGPVAANWEPGQVNDVGATAPGGKLPQDRQAARLAYTLNAALVPRNYLIGTNTPRLARFVPEAEPQNPSGTILMTELVASPTLGWMALATQEGVVKSHRPVTPFLGLTAGLGIYLEPTSGSAPRFRYAGVNEIVPLSQIPQNAWNMNTELNAVGRHHAGGSAHFAFLDLSVRRTTVQSTIADRQWGERFWSITGNNAVVP